MKIPRCIRLVTWGLLLLVIVAAAPPMISRTDHGNYTDKLIAYLTYLTNQILGNPSYIPEGMICNQVFDNTAILNAALAAQQKVVLPLGYCRVTSPILVHDGQHFSGLTGSGQLNTTVTSALYIDSSFVGDAVIKSAGRDDNIGGFYNVVTIEQLRIAVFATPSTLLSGIDITGFRSSKIDHVWLSGPGIAAANAIALMVSDRNPTNTSHKSTFFNRITNIDMTGAGWGTCIKYRHFYGDANSNQFIGMSGGCAQPIDVTEAAGIPSASVFRDMYFATSVYTGNYVFKDLVYPNTGQVENVNGEGFNPIDAFIRFKLTDTNIPLDVPEILVRGPGPHDILGTLRNYSTVTNPVSGIFTQNLYPYSRSIAMLTGGFGQNSNLLKYSEQFDNAAWVKTNSTITPNAHIDPMGVFSTADLVHATTGAGDMYQVATVPQVQSLPWTCSAYVFNGNLTSQQTIVLRVQTATEVVEKAIVPIGTWARVSATLTPANVGTAVYCLFRFQPQLVGQEVYLWGASLVQSDEPGVYVRTAATAQTTVQSGAVVNTTMRVGQLNNIPVPFADLGTPDDGAQVYCSDCTIANPCAGASTGAFAKRVRGAWVCN